MTINTHGITGRLFRKAAFNGLPIPDEKPQAKEETDAEHEESYVDVFDLALRHSVSDVYVPLPGNELTLTVQRVLAPEVWGTHPGLKPWELPNKPFGPCWDTNLCPHIRFGFLVTDSKSEPDWVDVVDENGTSYRFVLIWRREEPPAPGSPPPPPRPFFLPMPSNRTEQDNYLCSLEVVSGAGDVDPDDVIASMPQWTFRFRRKFGTTLYYENTAVARSYRTSPLPPPIPEPGEPPPVDPVQYYFYARLTRVEDRFGNELRYELDAVGNNSTDWLREDGLISGLPLTLLPSRIVAANVTPGSVPERTITIRSERVPLPPSSSGISPASVRRVLKVYPPRAHATSGEMLEEHTTLYTYAPVDPTFYNDPVVPKGSVPSSVESTPILFRPLTKVLRPEGMLTEYEWITEIEKDTNPADPSYPDQYFFHTNLGALKDSAGIGYRFHYLFNQFQKAYSDNPELEPQGWYCKSGLRAYVRIIGGPESTSFWSPLRDDASGAINTNGVPPELLLPEKSGDNFDVEPIFRAVIDGEGHVRRWVFDEHVIYQADEIQRLLFPSEDQQRSLEWLVLWTRVTVIHPLPHPDHPLLNITESATYNALAGLATRTLLDFCGSFTEWEHADTWDIAQVHGLEWLAAAAPAGWFFKFYTDPTAQINALSHRREFTYYSNDPNLGAARIMIRVKDEEDRTTSYEIDPVTGNRTSEKVWTAPAGTPPAPLLVRHTVFDYHPVFRSFLTSRTTKHGLILPDGSNPDMVETFNPDAWGYTHREVRGAEGTAGQFSLAVHEHDENGNRTRTTDGAGNRTDFHYDAANRLDAVSFFGTETTQLAARSLDYDARGNKTLDIDENGHSTEFRYDGENRVKLVRKLMGSDPITLEPVYLEASYQYNRVGSRTQTTDPNGNISRTFYDALQRPTDNLVWKDRSLTPPADTSPATQKLHAFVTSFDYDIHHHCGHTVFDTSGFKPTTIIHPKLLAGPSGPTHARSYFNYDALYRAVLEKHEYEAGLYSETTRVYNPTGTVWKETDPAGLLAEHTYDAENRPLTQTITNPAYPGKSATVSKSYTAGGLEKDSTNERGAISAIRYDLAGRAARTIAPDPVTGTLTANSPVTQSVYDPAGNLRYTINPLGHEWEYRYDYRNRRVREILPAAIDAGTTGFPTVHAELITVYDPAGNVTEKHDARGNVTLTDYDPANRPWRVTAPLAAVYGTGPLQYAVTTSELDANGNILSIADPAGNIIVNGYDGLNRLTKTTVSPAPGQTIVNTFAYDEANNRTSVIDGEGHETRFTYDGLNRLTATTFDHGTLHPTTTVETWGPLLKTSRIECPGTAHPRTTNYHYDFRHRLEDVKYGSGSPHAEDRHYTYDPAGNLLTVTHPHAPDTLADTAQDYDYLNRVIWETSAGFTHHYDYDKAGNRTLTTYSGGRTLTCTYDALNRLSTCTEAHPTSGEPTRLSQYLYDRDGHIMFKSLPGGTVEEKAYDTRGRTTAQHTSAPSTAGLLWPGTAAWTAAGPGVTATLTFPGTRGAWITKHFYEYDNPGNIRCIDEETPSGSTPGMALPDRRVTNDYDGTYRLINEQITTWSPGVSITSTTYGYDKAGNRTLMVETDAAGNPASTTYHYGDPNLASGALAGPSNQVRMFNRYEEGAPPAPFIQFFYSPYGCRTHRTVTPPGTPLPVTPPATGADTFTWDRENRLIASDIVTGATSATGVPRTNGPSTFRYDHRTRRFLRSTPAGAALITFSGGLSVQEYPGGTVPPGSGSSSGSSSSSSSSGGPAVEYIRGSDYGGGIGGILYTIRGGHASCQHYNSRGDVVAKSDATSTAPVTWAAAYLAFGTRPEECGTNPDPQRANTKEEDPTGLLNEGHRYRCLETGMFISRDPAGFVDGPNLYAYVRQNPWTKFDPEGLADMEFGPTNEDLRDSGISENQIAEYRSTESKIALTVTAGVVVSIATGGAATPLVTSAGLTGATASTTVAVIAGAAGGAATQITSNALNDAPITHNVASSAVTGGLFGGVFQTVGNMATAFRQGMAQASPQAAQATRLMTASANLNQRAETGVQAAIVDDMGTSATAVSSRAARELSQPVAPLHPEVRASMGRKPNYGGGCAEPQATSVLKNAGGRTQGAVMTQGNIRPLHKGHAAPRDMCSTCATMARRQGIIDLNATLASPYYAYYSGMSGPSGAGVAFTNSLREAQKKNGKRRR